MNEDAIRAAIKEAITNPSPDMMTINDPKFEWELNPNPIDMLVDTTYDFSNGQRTTVKQEYSPRLAEFIRQIVREEIAKVLSNE